MTAVSPILSIIIVSYNTAQLTVNCLKSIKQDKGLQLDLTSLTADQKIPAEVIVVDNNSTDNSVLEIKKFPFVKLIANRTNKGFGAANNQGFKIARGNYVLLLNSDTVILHSAITQALDWLSSHPEAGVCTAQLLNQDKTIQESGGFFPNLANIFTWSFNLDDLPFINRLVPPFHPHSPHFYTRDPFYLTDHPQDWVTGAFMLLRKNLVEAVGGFDEDYFMYGEEYEMCYRIKKKFPQTQVWYLVGPQIIHLGRGSADSSSAHLWREYQGVISFFRKHKPLWQLPLVKILLKINTVTHQFIAYLRGKPEAALAYRQICSKI